MAVNAVEVATMSNGFNPRARPLAHSPAPNWAPNTSRPVVLGGGARKKACSINSSSRLPSTRPWAASAPPSSYCIAPSVARRTASSISMLPGPLSKAKIAVASAPNGGRYVALAIPPMFWAARIRVGWRSSRASTNGTSGAPCPPAAMSRARKFEITVAPVRSAMTAGEAICSVL